jgi:aryl-alcohol dehydrogenase-like predicted oxidoreductase
VEYVNLGRTGLKVSRLCLGAMSYGDPAKGWNPWILPPDEGMGFIRQALELGINFFDVADMYAEGSSEEFLGDALGRLARRDEVVIATKVGGRVGARAPNETRSGWPTTSGLSRKHIFDAVDASLRRLKIDYIDLYQIHGFDPDTPIAEMLEALHDVVKSGKVRYIGASNTPVWRLAQALYSADLKGYTRFVSLQHHYNLLYREDERDLTPFLADEGVASLPWSPLARGFLAGNRKTESGDATTRAASDPTAARMYGAPVDFAVAERVSEVAAARGVGPTQVALAWLLSRPATTIPVIGATKSHHLPEAAAAVPLRLSAEEIARLEEPYQRGREMSPR